MTDSTQRGSHQETRVVPTKAQCLQVKLVKNKKIQTSSALPYSALCPSQGAHNAKYQLTVILMTSFLQLCLQHRNVTKSSAAPTRHYEFSISTQILLLQLSYIRGKSRRRYSNWIQFLAQHRRYVTARVIEGQNWGLSLCNCTALRQDESWLELLHIQNQSGHKNYLSIHWMIFNIDTFTDQTDLPL